MSGYLNPGCYPTRSRVFGTHELDPLFMVYYWSTSGPHEHSVFFHFQNHKFLSWSRPEKQVISHCGQYFPLKGSELLEYKPKHHKLVLKELKPFIIFIFNTKSVLISGKIEVSCLATSSLPPSLIPSSLSSLCY